MYNPETIHLFQQAVRKGDYNLYKEYYKKLEGEAAQYTTLRSLLEFNYGLREPVPLGEVEPVERIVTRF